MLRQSGVDLVVKGFATFMKSLEQGERTATKLDKTLARLRERVERLTRQWSVSGKSMENAWQRLQMAQRNMEDSTRRYEDAVKATAAAEADTTKKVKDRTAAIEAAKKAENAALREMQDDFSKYVIAVNNLFTANSKLTATFEYLQKAQKEFRLATEDAENGMSNLVQVIAGMLPMGNQLLGVFTSLGATTSGVLIPAMLALGGVLLTVKAALFAVNAAFNVVKFTINTLISVVKGIGNAFITAFRAVASVIEWATRPLRTFMQHVIEIASGIALWRAIRNIGAAFRQVGEEIFFAVASFQGLEIRLESLMARDYARGLGVSMAEAFKETAGSAAVLFDWVRKLAVTTPFNVTDIAQIFTLGSAMGFTVDKTKELTEATVNFAAGMNLADEVLWRIVYNFGQMIQRGKLSGEEFRDLARNMVPIDDIMASMAERAGMTKEAFREMALEGGVPVTEFLEEFITIANRDFPDAAKRMAKTWQGVTNNIRDFIEAFIGLDVIKPVMDKFTATVADALDRLLNDERLQRSTKFLGQVLLSIFNYLTPAVDKLVGAFKTLFSAITGATEPVRRIRAEYGVLSEKVDESSDRLYGWARSIASIFFTIGAIVKRVISSIADRIEAFAGRTSPLSTLAEKAKEWGFKFIEAFSKGVSAGIRLLTIAIGVISQVLKTFFKPGSPPLIAPEIDVWGMETMNEWLKGFTMADFDIFNDVADLIESYMRSIADKIGETSLIPSILQARTAIAGILAGNLGAGIVETLNFAGMGEIGQLFEEYLNILLRLGPAQEVLTQATAEVEAAQQAVDEARAAFDNFDESIYGVVEAEEALAAASAKVEAIQAEITEATEKYEAILAGLRSELTKVTTEYDEELRLREIAAAFATQLLTAEEKERLEMEKRAIEIERQIRSVEDQRDLEIAALKAQLEQAKNEEQAAKDRLQAIQDQIDAEKELLQVQIEQAEKVLDAAKARQDAAEEAIDLIEAQADAVRSQIEALIEQNNLLAEHQRLLEQLAEDAEEAGDALEDAFKPPETAGAMEDFLGDIDQLIADAEANADEFFALLAGFGEAWQTGGAPAAFKDLKGAWDDLKTTVNEWIGDEGLLAKVQKGWDGIRDALEIPEGMDFITWLKNKVEEYYPIIEFGAKVIYVSGALLLLTSWKLIEAATNITSRIFKDVKPTLINYKEGAVAFKEGVDLLAKAGDKIKAQFPKTSEKIGDFTKVIKDLTIALLVFNPVTLPFVGAAYSLYQGSKYIDEAFALAGKGFKRFAELLVWSIDRISDKLNELQITYPELNLDEILAKVISLLTFGIPDIISMLQGRQYGGRVKKGRPYLVGESGPEPFVPDENGYIFPDMRAMVEAVIDRIHAPAVAAPNILGATSIDKSIKIEINPTYSQTQSEASIYYDVAAALAMAWR